MGKLVSIKRGVFVDSVRLMKLTDEVKKIKGVENAFISLGTDANKRLMSELGLLDSNAEKAGPDDLIIAVEFHEGTNKEDILKRVEETIFSSKPSREEEFQSIGAAVKSLKPNLAVVSLPGEEAVSVAEELINMGVNVHLFSDHVSLDDEVRLKKLAHEKNLLLLGPGSGTSIINGKGICFANAVERGEIGFVASAGTGLQEVISLLDSIGIGISHAFGVGGTDISKDVGAIMTKECLNLLQDDPSTKIICIISKQPSQKVVSSLFDFLSSNITKDVVGCFLGMGRISKRHITSEPTLHSCAMRIAKMKKKEASLTSFERIVSMAERLSSHLTEGGKYIRGVYSGGTLAHESLYILESLGLEVYSNTPLKGVRRLKDPMKSIGNTIVDMGDEFFTQGRAHPMIDATFKRHRLAEELSKRDVAVLMFDVILGYGVSDDPAGELIGSLKIDKSKVVLSRIVGTKNDRQGLELQREKLEDRGITVCSSNAEMAVLAAMVATRCMIKKEVKKNWGWIFGF